MALNEKEVASAFERVAKGEEGPNTRADLELYLLDELIANGADAVAQILQEIPAMAFSLVESDVTPPNSRYQSSDEYGPIAVDICELEDLASINISRMQEDESGPEQYPWHEWFYSVWMSIQTLSDKTEIERLSDAERTVYYIALFEAEVMNGGLGQYLANTDGQFIDETIDCLKVVGALRTADILQKARHLRENGETYDDTWETKKKQLEKLDEEFLAIAEDLGKLVANKYCDDGPW
ncbi:MAG: DMP19 family protein [Gammaproteobacteria bacterium]|nr:DMP19 family protein [Gammaproteobacteria bacterium]